jgi:hypothetical protein
MVRFSSGKGFAVSYTSAPGIVTNVSIQITKDGYLAKDGPSDRSFNTIDEILKQYSFVLKTPYNSSGPKQVSFQVVDKNYEDEPYVIILISNIMW